MAGNPFRLIFTGANRLPPRSQIDHGNRRAMAVILPTRPALPIHTSDAGRTIPGDPEGRSPHRAVFVFLDGLIEKPASIQATPLAYPQKQRA